MRTIHLIRHAQASWGADNYDQLSDQGYEQAATLGRAWAAEGFAPDLVVSGDLQRHQQTAVTTLRAAGLSVRLDLDHDWNEVNTWSLMEAAFPGLPRAGPDHSIEEAERYLQKFLDAVARWVSGAHDADYDDPFPAFMNRVDGAFGRVAERLDDGGHAVVFTSGGPVSACAARLLGDPAGLWPQFCTVVVNASVTKAVIGPRATRLLSFNEHGHLSEFTYI